MNQKLIIEAYKSIEYKGGEKLGNITVQINPDSYKLSKSTSYKKVCKEGLDTNESLKLEV